MFPRLYTLLLLFAVYKSFYSLHKESNLNPCSVIFWTDSSVAVSSHKVVFNTRRYSVSGVKVNITPIPIIIKRLCRVRNCRQNLSGFLYSISYFSHILPLHSSVRIKQIISNSPCNPCCFGLSYFIIIVFIRIYIIKVFCESYI